MVSLLVPIDDGAPQVRQGSLDLVLPSAVKKREYRLIAYTRDFGYLDLTSAVIDEWYYEELEGEFSMRLHATLDNTKQFKGKYPSDILLMPTQLEVHADWGSGFQRVFFGTMTTERREDTTYSVVAYDPLNRMLRSDSTLVLGAGKDAADGLDYLADRFQLPIIDLTAKPRSDVKLDAFISRGDRVAAIYDALFSAHYGITGEEWRVRWDPRGTSSIPSQDPRPSYVGGVEYILRSRPGLQTFMLEGDKSAFDHPVYTRSIDDLVTVVMIVKRPTEDTQESDRAPRDDISVEGGEVWDDRPGNSRDLFGDYIRIIYLDPSNDPNERDSVSLKQKKAEARLILNEFGRPSEQYELEALDLPWLRRWDRVFVQYPPMGDVYTIESVTHDCLSGKMRISAEPQLRNLLFPSQWSIPDGEVPETPEQRHTNDADLLAGIYWPFPGSPNVSGYDFHDPSYHNGVDLYGGSQHATLYGSTGKVVTVENRAVGQGSDPAGNGYGNYVVIDCGKNNVGETVTLLYAHMYVVDVRVGQEIKAGQTIGLQGNTGKTSGAGGGYHCHFEVRFDNVPVNPHSYCATWSL